MGELLHHIGFIITREARVDGRSELDPRPEGTHRGYGSGWTVGVGRGRSVIRRSFVVVRVVRLSRRSGEGARLLPRPGWRVVVIRLVMRVRRHFG